MSVSEPAALWGPALAAWWFDREATQRKLLEEAFTSSERMVHLIGDFLNVSRLQTGKFIIDRHPARRGRGWRWNIGLYNAFVQRRFVTC